MLDDLHRDVLVFQVPLVGVRHHLGEREAAHLVLNGGVGLVEAGVAEAGGVGLRGDQLGEARLDALAAALDDERRNAVLELADVLRRDAHGGRADDFELAHRNAAGDLRQVLAECGGEQQLLELAEAALAFERRAPAVHLPQRLDRRRQPREAVGRVLRGIDAAHLNCTLMRTPALPAASTLSAAATAPAAAASNDCGPAAMMPASDLSLATVMDVSFECWIGRGCSPRPEMSTQDNGSCPVREVRNPV